MISKYERYANWKKKLEEADEKVKGLELNLDFYTKERASIKECLEKSRKKLKEELEEIMEIKV